MRIERIGKHRIELFNGIDELPTERFFAYNRMLLIDSGIGGDMESVDSHIGRVMRYLGKDMKKEANQELLNLRSNIYFVLENMSPKYLSYVALIDKIDGVEMRDFSDENLKRVLKDLSRWGASKGFMDRALDVVKKKLRLN